MNYSYKIVSIFCDPKGNLIVIPLGDAPIGLGEIEPFREIGAPYDNVVLLSVLNDALEDCWSKDANVRGLSVIEKATGKKGYARAVANLMLVDLKWDEAEGYSFMPTGKYSGKGFDPITAHRILLGDELDKDTVGAKLELAFSRCKPYFKEQPLDTGERTLNPYWYNMGWLAIPNASTQDVVEALKVTRMKAVNWDTGVEKVYSHRHGDFVYITPQVGSCVFVLGKPLLGMGNDESIKRIETLICNLSTKFGTVRAFGTFRVIEYHHWMMAVDGKLERSFAYVGESGEILSNAGQLTAAETSFNWSALEDCLWSPDEEDVIKISQQWSANEPNAVFTLDRKQIGTLGKISIQL